MATHATTTPPDSAVTPAPDQAEINAASMKGWKFFTNFLLWNVIATIGALIVIGLLTVWS